MKQKYWFVLWMLFGIFVISTGLTAIYVKSSTKEENEGEFQIVTSFYPMYIAAKNVIGDTDGVALSNLSEPQTGCLHDYQLTPEDMKLIAGADVFIINGGGIEGFLSDIAREYPELVIVNASEGVDLLSSGAYDHSHGKAARQAEGVAEASGDAGSTSGQRFKDAETAEHDNGEENAHAWMSVADHRIQVAAIAEALAELDPVRAKVYQSNAAVYDEKLLELEKEQEEIRNLAAGCEVILFHEAYAYAAQDYGMEAAMIMDLDEERQVSAGEIAEILEEIEQHDIKLILAEELYGKGIGDTVEAESDVTVLYLDTLNRGDYHADSYLDGMRANMEKLRDFFL